MDVTASREKIYSTSPCYHKGRRAYTKRYKLSVHRVFTHYNEGLERCECNTISTWLTTSVCAYFFFRFNSLPSYTRGGSVSRWAAHKLNLSENIFRKMICIEKSWVFPPLTQKVREILWHKMKPLFWDLGTYSVSQATVEESPVSPL